MTLVSRAKNFWPLRKFSSLIRFIISIPKKIALFFMKKFIKICLTRPMLRQKGLSFLENKPKLKAKLKQIAFGYSSFSHQGIFRTPSNMGPETLSPTAQKIYQDLQAAIQKHKEK